MYLASVRDGRELDERVEGDGDVGQVGERLLQEVGQHAPQHRLVTDQHNVALSRETRD